MNTTQHAVLKCHQYIAGPIRWYPDHENHAWAIRPCRWLARSRFRHCLDMYAVHVYAVPPPWGVGLRPSSKRCAERTVNIAETIRCSNIRIQRVDQLLQHHTSGSRKRKTVHFMGTVHAIKLLRAQASILSRPKRIQWQRAPIWHISGRNPMSSMSDVVIYCGHT